MTVDVRIGPCDPSAPARVFTELCAEPLGALPRARPVTLALLGYSPQAGACPTPWALRGVVDALGAAGLRVGEFVWLGPEHALPAGERATVRAAVSEALPELVAADSARWPRVAVALGPARAGQVYARIPRPWIGASLVAIVPALHRAPSRGARGWLGPVTAAWDQLGQALGLDLAGSLGPARAQGLVREIFAARMVVVDASWWGVRHDRSASPRALTAAQHAIAAAPLDEPRQLAALDAWIAGLAGLAPAADPRLVVDLRIEGQRRPWPRPDDLELHARSAGLLGAARVGLRAALAGARPMLTGALPGALGEVWTRWWAGDGGGPAAQR